MPHREGEVAHCAAGTVLLRDVLIAAHEAIV